MSPDRRREIKRHAREEGRAWLWGVVIAAALWAAARYLV